MWSPTNLVKLVSTGKRRRQMFICRGSNSGIFFFKTKRVDFERFVWLEMDVLNREVEGNKLNSQRERNVSKAASKLFQCFFEEAQNTWNREIGGMDHSRNGVCVKCKNKFLTTNDRKRRERVEGKKLFRYFPEIVDLNFVYEHHRLRVTRCWIKKLTKLFQNLPKK